MDSINALSAFSALSQPTRLDVFRLLIKAEPTGLIVGDMCTELDVRQNTLSANLAILLNAKLIRNEREGRSIRYFVNMDGLDGLLKFLLQDCCGGASDLCQPILDQIACSCTKENTND